MHSFYTFIRIRGHSMPITRSTVSVHGDTFERLKERKRDDESMNDVICRLLDAINQHEAEAPEVTA